MRKATFALLIALLIVPAALRAQHRVGVALAISDPRGEFDRNTDTGYGLVAAYRYGLADGILAIGADGAFQTYGNSRRRAPLSPTIPEIRVDVETSNNTSYLLGAIELEPPTGAVRPYAVLNGGFGVFFTTTALEDPRTDKTILTDTNKSDWTWIRGVGGGLRIRVHETPRPDRAPSRLWIDLGATWQKGGEVEYLREGTLVTDRGEIDIDRRLVRSEIELMLFRLGVSVQF